MVARSIALFVVAALFEIGGAWLVWQGVREHRGWMWIGFGVLALGAYGFVATLQPDAYFGTSASSPRMAECSSRAPCYGAWRSMDSDRTGGTLWAQRSACWGWQ